MGINQDEDLQGVFFQEFSKVWYLSLASTRLLLVVQIIASIALRAFKVSYSDEGEGGVVVNCEITQFFLNTLYNWYFKVNILYASKDLLTFLYAL